MRMRLPIRPSQ